MSISFVAAATGTSQFGNLVVNKPAGVVEGDIMFALWCTPMTLAAPSGWTFMHNDGNNQILCYKIATGSEPANYTLASGSSSIWSIGCIVAYRGNRRSVSNPLLDAGANYDTYFGFSDTIIFANANSQGTAQRDGMLFCAFVSTDSNGGAGANNTYAWPPSGMTSRVDAFDSNRDVSVSWADKGPVNSPITSQTPGNITFTHAGGSFQDWFAGCVFVNKWPNTQGIA